MPKRPLISDTNRSNAGAPDLEIPFSAKNLLASDTAPAIAARAAK